MSFDLVLFGGTGDLTWRKLMPALFQAFRHGKLPPGGRILSVARDEQSDEQYRGWLKERFQDVEGGKRPRSSMSPALVFGPDGRLRMVVGAAGGATIPAQVIRAIIGVIDWDLPVQDALALPVIFAPGTEAVFVEQGSWLEGLIPALKALGHGDVQPRNLPLKANAIELRGSQAWGAADPRSEGTAVSE